MERKRESSSLLVNIVVFVAIRLFLLASRPTLALAMYLQLPTVDL
jgi:hypothetical protein